MSVQFLPAKALVALILSTLAFWSLAQDVQKEDLTVQQVKELRNGLKQINAQLVRLRQIAVQSDQTQMGQRKAIQQQIEGIALSHYSLFEHITGLQADSQQQIELLQATTQRLRWTLGATVGLAALILFLFLFSYRRIQSVPQVRGQPPSSAGTESNEGNPLAPIAGTDQATGLRAMFGDESSKPQTEAAASPAPSAVESNSRPLDLQKPAPRPTKAAVKSSTNASTPTGPLAALVASDLKRTEQALSEARQSFMRPVQIP